MVAYKTADSEFEESDRSLAMTVITYYTVRQGCFDPNGVNPTTLVNRFGITKERILRVIPGLVSEGRVEETVASPGK